MWINGSSSAQVRAWFNHVAASYLLSEANTTFPVQSAHGESTRPGSYCSDVEKEPLVSQLYKDFLFLSVFGELSRVHPMCTNIWWSLDTVSIIKQSLSRTQQNISQTATEFYTMPLWWSWHKLLWICPPVVSTDESMAPLLRAGRMGLNVAWVIGSRTTTVSGGSQIFANLFKSV